MDFSRPISYNFFTINSLTRSAGGLPSSGYVIDHFDPSQIEVRQFLDGKGQQDGLDASDVFLGRRWTPLIVTAYGSTAGDFWDKHDDLLAAFSPTLAYAADTANFGFLPLTFYQPTTDIASWPTSTYPYGMPLAYYVRPLEPPRFSFDRDFIGGVSAQGMSLRHTVMLVARDPRKHALTASSHTIGTSTATAINLGNYPAEPVISIVSGSTTGALSFTVAGSSFTCTIDATSTTYSVTSIDRQFLKAGSARADLITANLTYPTLAPGNNTTIRGSLAGVTVTMSYRHAFT